MAFTSASCSGLLLVISSLLLLSSYVHLTEAQKTRAIVSGLSWNFYDRNCPKLESIIRKQLQKEFKKDIGQAAGLLRIHFHDCFVQGCDASLLLGGSNTERTSPPNLSLRPKSIEIIEDLLRRVHRKCGRVVSCADIATLAARDSIFLSGGPDYAVPLGRRDGFTFATGDATLANLPPPFNKTGDLLVNLATKGFDATDLVALSGAHTIGLGHCNSFTDRLYPNQDITMDKTFANNLKRTCPASDTNNTAVLDIRSPNRFDNKYYVNLMNRQGLFTSDQDLYSDRRTRNIVTSFAIDQSLFFEKFADAMVRMSQLSVLTGNQGEIRSTCSRTNAESEHLSSVVEEEGSWSQF